MLIRVLSLLVALAAFALLFASPPAEFDEAERVQRSLLLLGLAVAGLGMAVPWARWLPLTSPGRQFGLLSKAIGWSGACGAPFAFAGGHVIAGFACVLAAVSAMALWRGQAWAVWPWYVLAVAPFAGSLASVLGLVPGSGSDASGAYGAGQRFGGILGLVVWAALGVQIVREITAWRRKRAVDGAPNSPLAGPAG